MHSWTEKKPASNRLCQGTISAVSDTRQKVRGDLMIELLVGFGRALLLYYSQLP